MSTNDTILRPMTPSDIPALVALWKQTEGVGLGPGDDESSIAAFLERNHGLSPVAMNNAGSLIGGAMCGHDGRRGCIYHLAVHPDHRGRGLGRALVKFCLAGLAREGIRRCNAIVYVKNADAQGFWTRLGWRRRTDTMQFQCELPHP